MSDPLTNSSWLLSLSRGGLKITEPSAYFKMVLFSDKINDKGESAHPSGEPVEEQT